MPFFSRFKNKGAQPALKGKNPSDLTNGHHVGPQRPRWTSNWNSKTVVPEEVEELIHVCTAEMKTRAEALDAPFLLLPFRPATDSSGARSFIRNFYKHNSEGAPQYRGAMLRQELRLTEPTVLCSIIKWCWSRMPEGVVSWPVYEGFQIGERESNMARNAFETFIPISAESSARKNIIYDFFDLTSAVAAHGKMNGLGGRKLSRLAGWWAFEHSDDGKGFEGGYKSWTTAAAATSHLFFAYLRSLSPEVDGGMSLIERIPRSLQALLASTEYPPETPSLMQKSTSRVVMLVDSVSPTPFALLRRAKHFEYRDRDRVLREYAEFEDPVDALTNECKRVLYAIASTNSSAARSRHGGRNPAKTDESWSAFQNQGFADMDDKTYQKAPNGVNGSVGKPLTSGLRTSPRSRDADQGRPTTPSWADFLSSGFNEDGTSKNATTLLMPPDQVLPPIGSRAHTPYMPDENDHLAPGELAAITSVDLDDSFWWVWMTSLASEEPADRKAVFGRCAIIETTIMHGKWLIMEEQVKGASPDPDRGAYVVQKKSFLSTFTKRGRLGRKKSNSRKSNMEPHEEIERVTSATPSKSSLAPDQQSRIKQAAAALRRHDTKEDDPNARRGRHDDSHSTKTNSMLTLGLQNEAGPAMKFMAAYDKDTIRKQYLGDGFAGTGMSRENVLLSGTSSINISGDGVSDITSPEPALFPQATYMPTGSSTRDLPALPDEAQATPVAEVPQEMRPTAYMPPSSLEVNTLSAEAKQSQHEAEKVPVPEVSSPSAMEKELAVDTSSSPTNGRTSRKPVTQPHPAFRQRNLDEHSAPQTPTSPSQNWAALAAQKAMETGPESKSGPSSRSQKAPVAGPGNSTGLKKMFGRKKDNPNRNSIDVNHTNGLTPPDIPSRRKSLMRRKPPHVPTFKDSQVDIPQPTAYELDSEPVMPESHGRFQDSSAAISNTDSVDRRHAEQEFARFDQGPVDMPAVTPVSGSEQDLVAPVAQRKFNTRLAAQIAPQSGHEDFSTPMERPEPELDAQSEATMEEPQEVVQPEDRWAKIRENAARRAANAAKAGEANEDQSAPSRPSQSQRTDDGETSGEETIESRVARIKARVAELTGGMDGNAPRR